MVSALVPCSRDKGRLVQDGLPLSLRVAILGSIMLVLTVCSLGCVSRLCHGGGGEWTAAGGTWQAFGSSNRAWPRVRAMPHVACAGRGFTRGQ